MYVKMSFVGIIHVSLDNVIIGEKIEMMVFVSDNRYRSYHGFMFSYRHTFIIYGVSALYHLRYLGNLFPPFFMMGFSDVIIREIGDFAVRAHYENSILSERGVLLSWNCHFNCKAPRVCCQLLINAIILGALKVMEHSYICQSGIHHMLNMQDAEDVLENVVIIVFC